MRIITLIVACYMATIMIVQAQQFPNISFHRENIQIINAGATGYKNFARNFQSNTDYSIAGGAAMRLEWTGLDNAFTTQALWGEYFIPKHNLGLGAHIINDKAGPISNTGIYLNTAYHLTLGRGTSRMNTIHKLAIGLSFGMVQYRLNSNELDPLETNDIRVLDDNNNNVYADAGLGVFYYSDQWYGGISIPQLFNIDLEFSGGNNDFQVGRVQKYLGIVGTYLDVGNDNSFFEPTIMARMVEGTPFNMDFRLRYQHRNAIWLGLGFGTQKTGLAEVGVLLKNRLKIAYLYSLHFNKLVNNNYNTYELSVSYAR